MATDASGSDDHERVNPVVRVAAALGRCRHGRGRTGDSASAAGALLRGAVAAEAMDLMIAASAHRPARAASRQFAARNQISVMATGAFHELRCSADVELMARRSGGQAVSSRRSKLSLGGIAKVAPLQPQRMRAVIDHGTQAGGRRRGDRRAGAHVQNVASTMTRNDLYPVISGARRCADTTSYRASTRSLRLTQASTLTRAPI